jgi:hypothetical protein
LIGHADIAVVGSAVIAAVRESGVASGLELLKRLLKVTR